MASWGLSSSFSQLLNKYLLNAYHAPGTILVAEDTGVYKPDKGWALMKLTF